MLGSQQSMPPFPDSIVWQLPPWCSEGLVDTSLADDDAKMLAAIGLARTSIEHGGGPFGALIVEQDTGRVVAVGANQVVAGNCSLLHAETLAIAAAQARLRCFTLSHGNYELVTSSEPCVQCLGAVFWSGLSRLLCGALVEDAERLGFDEGPRREDWQEQLRARGVTVATGVCRDAACHVLESYLEAGGEIYNARSRISG